MSELVENLHRQELTPSERAAHTTAYAGWLKKLKLVQPANQKQSAMMKTSKNPRRSDVEPHDAVQRESDVNLPTVKEKLAADLGVDTDTLERRHHTAMKLAERVGVKVEGPRGLETMDADKLIEVGEADDEANSLFLRAQLQGLSHTRLKEPVVKSPADLAACL
jgi:hypothetical protein